MSEPALSFWGLRVSPTHAGLHLAICQGAAGFKDVPPFTIAAGRNRVAGLNVIGLRRAGFGSELRAEIRKAFALVYRHGLNVTQALSAARQHQWSREAQSFFDFLSSAKERGVCALTRRADAEGSTPTAPE